LSIKVLYIERTASTFKAKPLKSTRYIALFYSKKYSYIEYFCIVLKARPLKVLYMVAYIPVYLLVLKQSTLKKSKYSIWWRSCRVCSRALTFENSPLVTGPIYNVNIQGAFGLRADTVYAQTFQHPRELNRFFLKKKVSRS
jgi:hypothetical protein